MTDQNQGTTAEDRIAQTAMTTTGETNTSALAAAAQASVLARYTMADRKPREWLRVEQRVLADCQRPSFAKAARYRKPIGAGIVGPSIRFAESCLRNAGNMACEASPSYEDRLKRVVVVTVTDYETNATFSAPVTVPKTVERADAKGREVLSQRLNSNNRTVFTVEATEDELLNTQNALVSKAMRTLILRMIPADIVENGQAQCVATAADADAKDPTAAIREIASDFLRVGVTATQLAIYLGHAVGDATREERTELRAIVAAIHDGEATWAATVAAKSAAGEVGPGVAAPTPKTSADVEAMLAQKIADAATLVKLGNAANAVKRAEKKEEIDRVAVARLTVLGKAKREALAGAGQPVTADPGTGEMIDPGSDDPDEGP